MSAADPADEPTSVETAAERDRVGSDRDDAAVLRDHAADLRDAAGTRRDAVGDVRDEAAHARDTAGDRRDGAADERDLLADERDDAAAQRDLRADDRDRVALRDEPEQEDDPARAHAALRYARARWDAAGDREQAASDRREGARGRTQAESDRGSASDDRRLGAVERVDAGIDRESAHGDRGSGADGRSSAAVDRASSSLDRGQASVDLTHASLDGLTGVYTRSAGLLEAQREVDRAQRSGASLVLAFVDVDGLKAVNDTGGHAAGDRVLVRVAGTLRRMLRPYDLVVRHGGDEFLCVLSGIQPEEARTRLGGVNPGLAGGVAPASVSIGVAELRSVPGLTELIAAADDDLYRGRAAR
jgi:diguanylate cyclase (GGDEF)-like protein